MTARASHPKGTGKTCVFWKPASSVVLCDVGSGSSPQARDWLGFSPSNQPARFFPKSLPLPHQVREVGPIAPLGPGRAPTPTPRLHGTPTLHPGGGALGGESGAWEETTWGVKKISPFHVSSLVQGQIPRLLPVKFPVNSSWLHCKKVRMGGGGQARGSPSLCFIFLTYEVEKLAHQQTARACSYPGWGARISLFNRRGEATGLSQDAVPGLRAELEHLAPEPRG